MGGGVPLSAGRREEREGFLTLHEVAFRRTHDLNELGKHCIALDAGLTPLLEEAAGLTDYAVVFRYLDAPHEPDEAEAESALAIAQHLYDRVRGLVGLDESEETEGGHE